MDEALTVREDVVIPASEMWFTAARSGGAGGQHVNKTSSRVTLHWHVESSAALTEAQRRRVMQRLAGRINQEGVLTVSVDTERSQYANLRIARERLADLIRSALRRQRKRIPTRVPKGAKERRLREKSKRTAVKQRRKPPGAED